MKRTSLKVLLIGLVASVLLVSCGGETSTPTATPIPSPTPVPTEAPTATPEPVEPTPEPEEVGEIMEAASAYFGEGFKLITADALYENLNDGDETNDPYIIDIRKPEDYEIAHLPGAVNVGGGELFTAETLSELPTDGQVVVYCYTGQTAGQAVAALNMLGYDAFSLKFGMPSWAIVSGSRWSDDISMGYEADTEPVEASGSYEMPEPMAEDMATAAEAYFGEGFKLITAEAVYENLNDGDEANDPFLIDIRKAEDYTAGHLPGAVNLNGEELFTEETLALLPPDAQVVVYCYTGQTAGQATAALNLLGYDAYSLKFGMPSWTIIEGAKRWSDDMSMGYPVEGKGQSFLADATAYFGEGFQLITADALYENLNDGDEANDPLIIDIRKPEDYAAGHVPGAVSLSGAALFKPATLDALPTDQQIVVYCYTGQTAGQATGALNVLGYDAYSLKSGMPAWAIAEGASRWNDDMSMGYEVETEANELSGSYDLPDPMGTTAAQAAAAYFGDSFQLITADALYENLNDGDEANDPTIIDIRKAEDYEIGHVPGAVNVAGGALFTEETLTMIPPDVQVVVYCYSGQTAGQATSVLNMLGYDTYSLKFGMPSWAITEGAKLWSDDASMGYEMETEAHKLPGLEAAGGDSEVLDVASSYFTEGFKLITADAVYENLNDGDEANDPVIIDIRKAEDYEIGHVTGAVNVAGGELFTDDVLSALPKDGQIVVYCYSGQTAGQATAALNLLGYDAYSLKFGMPSWAITEGAKLWSDETSMSYPTETDLVEVTELYELPDPMAADVEAAAESYFGEGFQLITADAVYENLNDGDEANDPFIIDIRKPEDYTAGHLPGAVNVAGDALFEVETLKMLPPDEQIVVYCYTGQTAGQATAALNLLGYDAYSLKSGMPAWAITTGSRWNDDMSMGYPVDTEAHELP